MIEHFNELSLKEAKEFQKFVRSPYLNSNKQLIKLVDFLISQFQEGNSAVPEKKLIYKKVFGSDAVNAANYRKLISDYSKLFDKYLIYTRVEKETVRNKLLLLNALRFLGNKKRFLSTYKEIKSLLDKIDLRDNTYYENQIELFTEYYYFNYSTLKSQFAKCLEEKSYAIDLEFLFHKLHIYLEMIYNENQNNGTYIYDKTFFDVILKFVRENEKKVSVKHPNLFVIYNVVLLWTTNDIKYLNILLDYFEKEKKKLIKDNLKYYYYYVLSYLSSRINAGEIKYRKINMEILKKMMDKDMFLIDNLLTHSDFNSVVNIALPSKEYDWLTKFIDKYKDKLEPEFRNDAYNLAMAKLNFHKKDYKNIFYYLNEVHYKDPGYYINSKFLLSRVYFDSKNFQSLEYSIENLRQYIREKQNISTDQVNIVKTFVYYLSGLIKIYWMDKKSKEKEIHVFKKEIENEKNFVPNENWFNEKIEEFIKSF